MNRDEQCLSLRAARAGKKRRDMTQRFQLAAICICSLALSPAVLADAPPDRYTVSTDTITDNVTSLTWQRSADSPALAQGAAVTYCNTLALATGGWRLPTRAELLSIADRTKTTPPAIDSRFLNTSTNAYWSSSVYADAPTTDAWVVDFLDGDSFHHATSQTYNVRCVR
jgi:hypothetical protein